MGREQSKFSTTTRLTVRRRSGGWCERCAVSPASQMHHRDARGMGGSYDEALDSPCNALDLCEKCHRWIESNRKFSMTRGWLVGHGQEASEVPVLYRGRWMILSDDGALRRTGPLSSGETKA